MSSVHPVPSEWAASAKINAERYDAMYAQSLSDPEGFWRKEAQRLDWMTPFTR
jgi:acetyl-CoA synthetase